MRKGILGLAILLLSGCGTINTVFRDDEYSGRELRKLNTHCDEIARVYSGVTYNFCQLNAKPASNTDKSGGLLAGVLLDGAISGVLDTVVLPYTLYRQMADGNIVIPNSTWQPGSVK